MQKELSYIFVCLLPLFLSDCSSAIKPKQNEVPSIAVHTQVVGGRNTHSSVRYVGTIEARTELPLSMQSGGRVLAVNCKDGDRVQKGQVLIRIDSTQAVNALRSAEATLRQAQDGFERVRQVYDKGAITDQQMVEIESKLSQAQALCDAAKQQVRECELRAPVSGIVSGMDTQVGQTLLPGVRVMTLLDMATFAVRFTVPETEISAISIGQKGIVECQATGDTLQCRVTEKSLKANQLAHTYEVKAVIDGGRERLRPGMVCKVNMDVANPNQSSSIVIPAGCVHLQRQYPSVWVVRAGKAERVEIRVGGYMADGVLVTQGLQQGDTLITDGYQKLYQGCSVIQQ
ncbi:MAG: efflux RND transporter periplasmic adaptor subunit [Paludibacteraceae bacterium]|nr:efflux RND transporter periplasmic adaptor subunit [Paludibacteraceae bacterium]